MIYNRKLMTFFIAAVTEQKVTAFAGYGRNTAGENIKEKIKTKEILVL